MITERQEQIELLNLKDDTGDNTPKYPRCEVCNGDESPLSSCFGMNICQDCCKNDVADCLAQHLVNQIRILKADLEHAKNIVFVINRTAEKTLKKPYLGGENELDDRGNIAYIAGLSNGLHKRLESIK